MTKYEFNQAAYSSCARMSSEQIKAALPIIDEYEAHTAAHYYMLLCKDANYYTVFVASGDSNENFSELVIECLREVGTGDVLDIREIEDGSAIELWTSVYEYNQENVLEIKTHPVVAYLFNYDKGIVEFGRK